MGSSDGSITAWLHRWRDGDPDALARLTDAVYQQLRRMAARYARGEADNDGLQATALAHELYMQLPGLQHIDFKSRTQFLSMVAGMMRHTVVDHARMRKASKRGGDAVHTTAYPGRGDPAMDIDVLLVHQALDRFARDYPRQARMVELRFFGGLTAQETADVLTIDGWESSLRTVERDWTFSRAWLHQAIHTP